MIIMIYSAHQISFLPWIGFWKKIYNSDYFDLSIYDQFTECTWIHFTYIGNSTKKYKWKLPIEKEFLKTTKYSIKDVKVKKGFANKLLNEFYDIHHNDKYFEYIYPLLKEWFQEVENLTELWLINFVLIQKIYNYLHLNSKLTILPYLDDNEDVSTKIARQTKMLECNTYLSGPHGRNYLAENIFEEKQINVIYQDTNILYQKYPESIVSLLSQYGVATVLNILKSHDI